MIKIEDNVNGRYLVEFLEAEPVSKSSLPQYKSTVNAFIKHYKHDIMVEPMDAYETLDEYIENMDKAKATKENHYRFITAWMKYTIKNNINNLQCEDMKELILRII